MKPIRMTILAALTAAIAIAPLASAEAHKRHKRSGVPVAIALGLITAGVIISQSNRRHHRHHYVHRHGHRCYGLPYHAYKRCMYGYRYDAPVVVYPHHGGYFYRDGYYYDGYGSRHLYKNGRSR